MSDTPKDPPDTSWVKEIEPNDREDRNAMAASIAVILIFAAVIITVALSGHGDAERRAPHEDRCLLANGRVVDLSDGGACLVDGRVTDRW